MKNLSFFLLFVVVLSCDDSDPDPMTTALNNSSWKIQSADVFEGTDLVQTLEPDEAYENKLLTFAKGTKVYLGTTNCGQWRAKSGNLSFKILGNQVVPGLCSEDNAASIFANNSPVGVDGQDILTVDGPGAAFYYFNYHNDWSAILQDAADGRVVIKIRYKKVDYLDVSSATCCGKL